MNTCRFDEPVKRSVAPHDFVYLINVIEDGGVTTRCLFSELPEI